MTSVHVERGHVTLGSLCGGVDFQPLESLHRVAGKHLKVHRKHTEWECIVDVGLRWFVTSFRRSFRLLVSSVLLCSWICTVSVISFFFRKFNIKFIGVSLFFHSVDFYLFPPIFNKSFVHGGHKTTGFVFLKNF